jgi:hypothetical protein
MRGGTQGSTFAKASDFAKATSDKTADGLSGIEDGAMKRRKRKTWLASPVLGVPRVRSGSC